MYNQAQKRTRRNLYRAKEYLWTTFARLQLFECSRRQKTANRKEVIRLGGLILIPSCSSKKGRNVLDRRHNRFSLCWVCINKWFNEWRNGLWDYSRIFVEKQLTTRRLFGWFLVSFFCILHQQLRDIIQIYIYNFVFQLLSMASELNYLQYLILIFTSSKMQLQIKYPISSASFTVPAFSPRTIYIVI